MRWPLIALLLVPAIARGTPMHHYVEVSDDAYPDEAAEAHGWRAELGFGSDIGSLDGLAVGAHGEVAIHHGRGALAVALTGLDSVRTAVREAMYARYSVSSHTVETRAWDSHALIDVSRREYFVEAGVAREQLGEDVRRGVSLGAGVATFAHDSSLRPSAALRVLRATDAAGAHYEVTFAITIAFGT
ncbi:MAG TPA: hypothetical protein VLX92_01845 [Kofleriaceae bacterium]|nr:hypothetical protein [Kofleriaceae bacterium]